MAERSPAQKLDELCVRYWDFQCAERPVAATLLAGASVDADVILREAPEDHIRRARVAREMLAELEGIRADTLGPTAQETYAMLARDLKAMDDAMAVHAGLRPSLFPFGVDFIFSSALGTTAVAGSEDAARYTERLFRVGSALEGLKESLRAGRDIGIRWPQILIDAQVAQLKGSFSVAAAQTAYMAPFQRIQNQPDPCQAHAARALEAVETHIRPAIADFATFLVDELGGDAARDTIACTDGPVGEAWYRYLIEQYGSGDADPEAIHATGLEEVARLSELCLQAAADGGYPGDLAAFRQVVGAPDQIPPSAEALKERIEILSKRIDGKIPTLFGSVPRSTYCIQSIPEAVSERSPPAYAQTAPADRSAAGIHWVTSLPQKFPAYMHIPLALHEAWPGHLMHFSLAHEIEGLPAFRRYGAERNMASIEGWAVYSESLGHEMGLYDTPIKRYGVYQSELWRAVRLVVDTGIHWKGWSREQALTYMTTHLSIPVETLSAEVDRYIGLPGQALTYQIGNIAIRKMRADALKRLGSAFRLREFHDCLMAVGPAPLPVLAASVDRWVSSKC